MCGIRFLFSADRSESLYTIREASDFTSGVCVGCWVVFVRAYMLCVCDICVYLFCMCVYVCVYIYVRAFVQFVSINAVH